MSQHFRPGDLVTVEFTTPAYRRESNPNPEGDYSLTGRIYQLPEYEHLWVGQHILVGPEGDLAPGVASVRLHPHSQVSA